MKDLKGKRTGHGCPEYSFPALSPKDFRIFQAQCCSLPLKMRLCHPSSLLRAGSRCPLGFQGGIPLHCLPLPMVLSGTSLQGAPAPQSQGQVPCWARVSEVLPPRPCNRASDSCCPPGARIDGASPETAASARLTGRVANDLAPTEHKSLKKKVAPYQSEEQSQSLMLYYGVISRGGCDEARPEE